MGIHIIYYHLYLIEWYKGCTLLLLRERWGGGNKGAVLLLPSGLSVPPLSRQVPASVLRNAGYGKRRKIGIANESLMKFAVQKMPNAKRFGRL